MVPFSCTGCCSQMMALVRVVNLDAGDSFEFIQTLILHLRQQLKQTEVQEGSWVLRLALSFNNTHWVIKRPLEVLLLGGSGATGTAGWMLPSSRKREPELKKNKKVTSLTSIVGMEKKNCQISPEWNLRWDLFTAGKPSNGPCTAVMWPIHNQKYLHSKSWILGKYPNFPMNNTFRVLRKRRVISRRRVGLWFWLIFPCRFWRRELQSAWSLM